MTRSGQSLWWTLRAVGPCVLLTVGIVPLFVGLLPPRLLDVLFNTDLLHPQALLDDVIGQGARLSDWTLPPNPSLFPDGLLFLFAWSVSPDFRWSLVGYAVLALSLTLISMRWILALAATPPMRGEGSLRDGQTSALVAATTVILLPLLWEVSPFHHGINNFMNILLVPISHGSTFPIGLVVWGLAYGALVERSKLMAGGLAALLVLAASSDRLVVTLVGIPLLAWLLLEWRSGNAYARKLMALVAISLGIGECVLRLISSIVPLGVVPNPLGGTWSETVIISLRSMLHDFTGNPHLALVCTVLTGWIATTVVHRREFMRQSHALRSVQIFLALCFVSALVTPVLTGVYREGAMRYIVPGIVAGLFGWYLSVGASLVKHWAVLLVSVLALLLPALVLEGTGLYFSYRPRVVRCLDKISSKLPTLVGVSDYWNSKRVSYLSQAGFLLIPLDEEGEFKTFGANRSWDVSKAPQVSFVVMDRLNLRTIKRRFGRSKEIAVCSGSKVRVFERKVKSQDDSVSSVGGN